MGVEPNMLSAWPLSQMRSRVVKVKIVEMMLENFTIKFHHGFLAEETRHKRNRGSCQTTKFNCSRLEDTNINKTFNCRLP